MEFQARERALPHFSHLYESTLPAAAPAPLTFALSSSSSSSSSMAEAPPASDAEAESSKKLSIGGMEVLRARDEDFG